MKRVDETIHSANRRLSDPLYRMLIGVSLSKDLFCANVIGQFAAIVLAHHEEHVFPNGFAVAEVIRRETIFTSLLKQLMI